MTFVDPKLPVKKPSPTTERGANGDDVPIPILPLLFTINCVPVELPIEKLGEPEYELRDSCANGVEEAMPTFDVVSVKIVDVPTAVFVPEKYAFWPVVPVRVLPLVLKHVPLIA